MKQGFSLLELSIVLVIIGLITGGIMAGRSMIRAAELRSVMTDYNKITTAIYTFKDKYQAIPGDMKNATTYWGAANPTLATCVVTASTGTETCDGNGDGMVLIGLTPVANNYYEVFRFWQHLANAGLFEGHYTGTQASTSQWDSVIGQNIPVTKISGASWSIFWANYQVGNTTWYDGTTGNVIRFGGQVANSWPYAAIFTPAELASIDQKMDDGKPGYGAVRTWGTGSLPNCATTAVAATADYQYSYNGIACIALFIPAW